jgi:hypothetical protein
MTRSSNTVYGKAKGSVDREPLHIALLVANCAFGAELRESHANMVLT